MGIAEDRPIVPFICRRHTLSRTLQSLSPLAAELFTTEMQLQRTEDLYTQPKAESLPAKILRVLRSEGLLGLVRKVLKKLLNFKL